MVVITTVRFGDAIKAAREVKGWSQADLADVLKVHQVTVSYWERTDSKAKFPGPKMLGKLARKLDLDLNELIRSAPEDDDAVPVAEASA